MVELELIILTHQPGRAAMGISFIAATMAILAWLQSRAVANRIGQTEGNADE